MKRRHLLVSTVLAATLTALPAYAQTTLRMTWYSDGNEGEVMKDLLTRFEAKNPDIKVVLDSVPFKAINENLPIQLAAGQGPDIARVVDLGGVSAHALDPEMINEVLDVMVELAQEGMTMMVVTHEMGFARKVAHRVVFMDQGRIVEDDKKEAFFGSPRSERAQQFLSKILHH